MRIGAIVLGIVGGIVGIYSAISAFSAVGSDPAYGSRLWAGWGALILAALAAVVALFISSRPVAAAIAMLVIGLLGFLSINLFYINTFYIVAVLLWLCAAGLSIIPASTSIQKSSRS